MQVLPINSYQTSFNGKIEVSPILKEIKGYAGKEAVARFEKMAERISKINDGKIFTLNKTTSYKMATNEVATIYNYNLFEAKNAEKPVFSVVENINVYSEADGIAKRKAMNLDVITDYFNKKIYPLDKENKLKKMLQNIV